MIFKYDIIIKSLFSYVISFLTACMLASFDKEYVLFILLFQVFGYTLPLI
jgi:hypothetical protein